MLGSDTGAPRSTAHPSVRIRRLQVFLGAKHTVGLCLGLTTPTHAWVLRIIRLAHDGPPPSPDHIHVNKRSRPTHNSMLHSTCLHKMAHHHRRTTICMCPDAMVHHHNGHLRIIVIHGIHFQRNIFLYLQCFVSLL